MNLVTDGPFRRTGRIEKKQKKIPATEYQYSYICPMKRSLQYLLLAMLVVPCCFAMGAAGSYAPKADFSSTSGVEKDNCPTLFTCHLFLPISTSERSVNPLVNPAPSSSKKQQQSPGVAATIRKQPGACTFSQYTALAHDFPIRHRKADLIFPFHYFW
jgi:hypothetical protein